MERDYQYPRFTKYVNAERNLIRNGFKLTALRLPFAAEFKNDDYVAYVVRMDKNRFEVFTYKRNKQDENIN